jgi:chromosome segregation and condensation protein ScpB
LIVRQRAKPKDFDRELADLPPALRWREFMGRVEAVLFAASQPVKRKTLVALIGGDCSLDRIVSDIRDEISSRPYELVEVAGGYQLRTRPRYGDAIRVSGAAKTPAVVPSPLERLVLTAVGHSQPITRTGIADVLGRPISHDAIAALRSAGLIANGPRSPQPGAPPTYVVTQKLLMLLGLSSLRDLPETTLFEAGKPPGRMPPLAPLDGNGEIDADDEVVDFAAGRNGSRRH